MRQLVTDLDDLARRDGPLQQLDARAKLLVTFLFLVVLASYGRTMVIPLVPMLLYPAVVAGAGSIPLVWLLCRLAITLPFIIGMVIAVFFGAGTGSTGLAVAGVVLLKSVLAVSASLLLAATTGWTQIGSGLQRLGLPAVLVTQLLLSLRYITVIVEQATRMERARSLRSAGRKGRGGHSAANLIAMLYLRTVQRAERLQQALVLRGFRNEFPLLRDTSFGRREWCYCLAWTGCFLLFRLVDLPSTLGGLLVGLL